MAGATRSPQCTSCFTTTVIRALKSTQRLSSCGTLSETRRWYSGDAERVKKEKGGQGKGQNRLKGSLQRARKARINAPRRQFRPQTVAFEAVYDYHLGRDADTGADMLKTDVSVFVELYPRDRSIAVYRWNIQPLPSATRTPSTEP
jgi:hypothetical protein